MKYRKSRGHGQEVSNPVVGFHEVNTLLEDVRLV